MRTRSYMPGSSTPSALGTSARKVICPVAGSTLKSENSRRPMPGYSLPSSSSRRTCAASLPAARASLPAASALRSFSTSLAGCVKFTYIGLICCTSASGVASVALTSAPSVTNARPMRPEIGALTVV